MATAVYEPKDDDEYLELDPTTGKPLVIRRGPRTDHYMIIAVLIGYAVLAVIIVLLIGLGFLDLAFGTTR